MIMSVDFINNASSIFQESSFLLQLEIQNFDIVCSPVWTSRDRCCDLPSMVSINEPEVIQKIIINSKFNNISVSLVLYLVLTTHLNHSCQNSQWIILHFKVLYLREKDYDVLELSSLGIVEKMSVTFCISVIWKILGIMNGIAILLLSNLFLDWYSKIN